ncbi:MAG: GlcNAc-transferase family protein, partial [Novosphingobium sp.]
LVQDWDAQLLHQAEPSGAELPLLTTYGRPFDPALALPRPMPTSISFHSFRQDGLPVLLCRERPDWEAGRGPERARFLSAHLLFAPGRFVEDVPYDPDLYFFGEEITLAARAFTSGYDLFHPGVHVMWHQEPRRVTPLHWNDHAAQRTGKVTAQMRDAASIARVRHFLRYAGAGPFGCGTSRSFAQYEAYAGLDFRRRYAVPGTRRGESPATPPRPGAAQTKSWKVQIRLKREKLPPLALDRPSFWYVGFHDEADVELAREDAQRGEISRILAADQSEIVLERCFDAPHPPRSWTVWPTDRQGRWLEKLSGSADPTCLS